MRIRLVRLRVLLVISSLSACGRVSFDDAFDAAGIDAELPCIVPAGDNNDDDDGTGDTCDTCPHLTGSQDDADRDGVGDICDPFPARPTERLARFEPFLAPPTWRTGTGSQFVAAQSALVTTATNITAWTGYRDDPTNTEVTMRGTIDAIGSGPKQLSLQFALEMGDGSEYCEVYGDPPVSFKITRGVPVDTFVTLAEMTIPALATGPFTMRFGHSASGLRCLLTTASATYDLSTPEAFAVPRDFIVLQFIELGVSIESFAQVDTTP